MRAKYSLLIASASSVIAIVLGACTSGNTSTNVTSADASNFCNRVGPSNNGSGYTVIKRVNTKTKRVMMTYLARTLNECVSAYDSCHQHRQTGEVCMWATVQKRP